ncbi:hypothetical protein D3C73_804500 [compost metagenome]
MEADKIMRLIQIGLPCGKDLRNFNRLFPHPDHLRLQKRIACVGPTGIRCPLLLDRGAPQIDDICKYILGFDFFVFIFVEYLTAILDGQCSYKYHQYNNNYPFIPLHIDRINAHHLLPL